MRREGIFWNSEGVKLAVLGDWKQANEPEAECLGMQPGPSGKDEGRVTEQTQPWAQILSIILSAVENFRRMENKMARLSLRLLKDSLWAGWEVIYQ